MIGQRTSKRDLTEIRPEEVVEAAYAILHYEQPRTISRWICEKCGMIHQESMPHECDSCGSKKLAQQADVHSEMNNHW